MAVFNNRQIYVIYLYYVYYFSWSFAEKITIQVPAPLVQELLQQARVCEKITGTPASQVQRIINNTLSEDHFHYCVSTKAGFYDEYAHFTDLISTLQVIDGDKEEYIKYLAECNKVTKQSAVAALAAKANCIHEKYRFVPATLDNL